MAAINVYNVYKFMFETPINLKKKVPAALLPKIPPCRGRRSPPVRGSGRRGSPGGGAGRVLFRRPVKLGPWEASGRAQCNIFNQEGRASAAA